MNKKQIKSGFFIALGVVSILFFIPAQAATIPPSNPFYPFQNAMRSLRRSFTFKPVGKALLEVRLTNERVSDIEQVLRAPYEESVLETALAAYTVELDALVASAKGATDDRVMDGVIDIVLRHGMLFDDVIAREGVRFESGVRDEIRRVKKDLSGLAPAVFGERAGEVLRIRGGAVILGHADLFAEIRAAEILTALEMQARSVALTYDSERLKDDLIMAFVGKVKSGVAMLEELPGVAGDELLRLQVLDEMRGRVLDLETRNALTAAREHMLEKAKTNRRITVRVVRDTLDYVRSMNEAAGIRNEQIIYLTEQAERFLENNAYEIAFQHASSAASAVNNAVLLSKITKKDLQQEVLLIKKQYDAAQHKPALIEKRIAAIADMIGRVSARETIRALREMKLALGSSLPF